MRAITGTIYPHNYEIHHPFLGIITGSSGSGKTTWIEYLIKSNKMSFRPKLVKYHFPSALSRPPVKVNYCKMSTNSLFFEVG